LYEGIEQPLYRALRAGGASLRAVADAMAAKGHKISHEGVARVLRAKTA
jgi:hypothetical protein